MDSGRKNGPPSIVLHQKNDIVLNRKEDLTKPLTLDEYKENDDQYLSN